MLKLEWSLEVDAGRSMLFPQILVAEEVSRRTTSQWQSRLCRLTKTLATCQKQSIQLVENESPTNGQQEGQSCRPNLELTNPSALNP